MKKITLDASMRQRLADADDHVELCDETGRTVGFFVSEEAYRRCVYAWAKTLFSDEELQSARAEPGGMTTDEAIRFLQSIAGEHGSAV